MQWNWNNMQNANTQAAADAGQRAALENELRQNEARIAELKAQLEQNRMNADELDRRLAANRAGIGDTATSIAHQRNIDDRAYKAAMTAYANSTRETEKRSLAEGQKKKLIAEIQDLDIQLSEARPLDKRAWLAKRSRLVEDLRELSGNYPDYDEQETPEELEIFKIKNTDKNGNWKTPEAKAYYDSQAQNTAEAAKNVKTSGKTAEQAAADRKAADERKKAIKKRAAELQESMIGNIEARADFATRWNNPNPDKEIIELKEIFTWDPKQGFKEKK